MSSEVFVGPYDHRPAGYFESDPRAAEVARRVGGAITSRLPDSVVEHIGSTSVPGLAGKGVVDLMLLYPPGQLVAARETLDGMGFQRQTGRDPWPEDRPMRVGAVEHGGERFCLHVHVLAADAAEVAGLRAFRDRLRADASLREEYAARKRAILAEGVTDTVDYCLRKGTFVEGALRPPRVEAFPARVETARLVLARPTEADFPDLLAMHGDPRVMATLGGLRSREELDAANGRLMAGWEQAGFSWWIARLREDGQFVGRGGLKRVTVNGRDEVEVGYGLAAEFWARGLATELAAASVRVGFEALDVAELVCFTLSTNARSRRVMEKVGFRYERDGEYAGLPHVFYRLRREDWRGPV
jgi:RimJ/RimL family protein N-acetyltransferase/GrpB-like predicted nucleotidyltransferase (UPF0157 family)